MTILKIDSSISGDASVSRQLTAATVAQLVSQNLDQRVVERDLVATPLSHLTLGGSGDADVSTNSLPPTPSWSARQCIISPCRAS